MDNSAQRSQLSRLMNSLKPKSIRSKLTLGIAAALVPSLVISFGVTRRFVINSIYGLTEHMLQAEAELISFGLVNWGRGITHTVESLASTKSFQQTDIPAVQATLNQLVSEAPTRQWRFWSASEQPKLLAYTGNLSAESKRKAELFQGSREYFKVALRGTSTYQVVTSRLTGKGCLNVSQPVFTNPGQQVLGSAQSVSAESMLQTITSMPIRTDLSGVLVLCIPLDSFGADSGLSSLFDDPRLSLLHAGHSGSFLSDPNGFTSAVILVSKSGQLLYPNIPGSGASVPTINDLRSSKTAELHDVAIKAQQRREIFDTINVNGHKYLALTADVDTAWSVVLLFSEEQATQAIRSTGQMQAIVGGLTLLFVLLFVAIRSRRISRPISEAGTALQKISLGDFDVHLSVPSDASNDDEVTGLLRNVQVSSDRLRAYLTEVTSFAVTQKELDTAKSIQRDFLLQELPESSEYQASAVSRPALEIGADWYDMVDAGNHVVFVVADVCDKGVPSALYMSVFRSLIRSKILDHLSDLSSSANAADVIRDAIARTNDYMAANQNSSMMFATVLIAAVHKETGVMSYLCAGHETPYILRSGEIVPLDQVSGPAIGLFGGADYSVTGFDLQPGDRLVLYSDGLVDARSPADEGFGHEKLEALLRAVHPCTSSQLMDIIVSAVDDHMDGADQFDDLTIMVFEWKGS